MAWLLDTNTWIAFLKPHGWKIAERLEQHEERDVALCSIVKTELWHGANKNASREERLRRLDDLFDRYISFPFDDQAARHYADIRHHLESSGRTIGPNDLKIAAICRLH
ncbi:MAG: type II toxin-antitoxin system VapC family toxin [Planctomycetales bacterium]